MQRAAHNFPSCPQENCTSPHRGRQHLCHQNPQTPPVAGSIPAARGPIITHQYWRQRGGPSPNGYSNKPRWRHQLSMPGRLRWRQQCAIRSPAPQYGSTTGIDMAPSLRRQRSGASAAPPAGPAHRPLLRSAWLSATLRSSAHRLRWRTSGRGRASPVPSSSLWGGTSGAGPCVSCCRSHSPSSDSLRTCGGRSQGRGSGFFSYQAPKVAAVWGEQGWADARHGNTLKASKRSELPCLPVGLCAARSW